VDRRSRCATSTKEMLGDQLTEQLVRLATNCAAVYHGWGTEK